MRFVIEAVGLTAGGGKELALDLLSRLSLFHEHQFVLFLPDLPEYSGLAASNVRCIRYSGHGKLFSRYRALQRILPRICEQHQADALLCLGNFVPSRSPCPTAVLAQNAYWAYRERMAEQRLTVREKLIVFYGRNALQKLRQRGVHIVVQTPVMRGRILSLWTFEQAMISVVPNAADCSRDSTPRPQRSGGMRPFTFLCLARYYAHKNLEILPPALKELASYTAQPFKCIITISATQHPNARKLLRRIEQEELGRMLVNIGPVRREALARAYRDADALILPTLLESCTRTYSEAMYYGLPILTSDRDFARYLCRDAAVYFDPLDPSSVAKSMATIMAQHALRMTLIANGQRIISELPNWDSIASEFVNVLERAAESRRQSVVSGQQRAEVATVNRG